MKIYNTIYVIAEKLEKERIITLTELEKISKNEDFTEKKKQEMARAVTQKYTELVGQANEERNKAIDDFIETSTLKSELSNPAKLSEVFGIIRNISNPLTDDELCALTKEIQKDYISMGILRKELNEEYPKTFHGLIVKNTIDTILKELEASKGLYFSGELGHTHLKYSLTSLQKIDEELEISHNMRG